MNADEIVRALRCCNRAKGHRCSECPVFSRYDYRICKATVDRAAVDLIESLQAQLNDVAPMVRGEWVLQGENERDYETSLEEKCSLCGRYVYRYDTQPQDNYCPNCGAKMEEHHD